MPATIMGGGIHQVLNLRSSLFQDLLTYSGLLSGRSLSSPVRQLIQRAAKEGFRSRDGSLQECCDLGVAQGRNANKHFGKIKMFPLINDPFNTGLFLPVRK